ncbi:MAG TPA: energy transducer TonB [Hyphomicrobium sp.]|jgi:protein TonB
MVEIAALAAELAGDTPPAKDAASVDVTEQPAASEETASLIGVLDADQRIRAEIEQNERTLWTSAIVVTLLYASVIAAQVMDLGGFSALEHELARRRGQDATTISVELVPDPDKDAKTKKWREGAQQAPSPAPPQPQQQAMLPQPEVEPQKQPPEEQAKEEPKEEPTEKQEKEDGRPSLPSLEALVDAAANDLNEKVKEHYDRKPRRPQPQQQAMYSGGGMQVRGQGASGKSDEFSKSVIAALMKTRPGPFALWGRVLVTFQITQQGDLLYVRVLHSSGNKALDEAAVNAIHKAQFVKPPEGLSPEARTYIIDYVFG